MSLLKISTFVFETNFDFKKAYSFKSFSTKTIFWTFDIKSSVKEPNPGPISKILSVLFKFQLVIRVCVFSELFKKFCPNLLEGLKLISLNILLILIIIIFLKIIQYQGQK